MKTLLKNCLALLHDGKKIKADDNIYISVIDDKIDYVGKNCPESKFDLTKDMSGKIVMPGLYNCHTHSPMVLLRGIGSGLPLNNWLFDAVFPIEDKLAADDIKAGTELALLEMISCGTVSFSDMYFFPDVTCECVKQSGLKANITRPVQSFDPNEAPEKCFRIGESETLYKNYNGYADGRVLIDFCVHAEYTCNPQVVKYYSDICKSYNGNMHIHLSETVKEHNECIEKYGKTPTEWFESLGAFDSSALAAHCVAVTDSDIEILRKYGVSVIHNPTSNMKLGSGFAPVSKFMSAGINVGLGTDGAASNNNLNMFEEMHLASVIHNGYFQNATQLNAEDIINMATVNGAKVQRRHNCGAIKAGNKADIIAVFLDKPHMIPCLDPVALIAYSAQGSDVCMTMCEGKILYENGEYKTLDKEKILSEVKDSVKRLYA
jgi:5-methylthioadenosine/S-adenosylhomocysteine deaminase